MQQIMQDETILSLKTREAQEIPTEPREATEEPKRPSPDRGDIR
jgi:hypothetical protein